MMNWFCNPSPVIFTQTEHHPALTAMFALCPRHESKADLFLEQQSPSAHVMWVRSRTPNHIIPLIPSLGESANNNNYTNTSYSP